MLDLVPVFTFIDKQLLFHDKSPAIDLAVFEAIAQDVHTWTQATDIHGAARLARRPHLNVCNVISRQLVGPGLRQVER